MKKVILSLAITAALSATSVIALADNCHVAGWKQGNTYDGPTVCNSGSEGGITVNGTLTSKGTSFTGLVTVNGPVDATDTKFSGGASIASNTVAFNSSQATTVTMRENGDQARVVNLNSGSNVNTVDFVGKPAGVVKLSGGSTVDKVINGSKNG